MLWAENSQDSLLVSNQIPELTTGFRNAHISCRTPPLPGPQVSALANCLSEAAGPECAGRNPSAEPDPAPAVGPRGAADHPQRGRPPCCALALPGPHARLCILSIFPRECGGCGPKCRGGEGKDVGWTIQQCSLTEKAKCAWGRQSDFPGDLRVGGG